MQMGDAARSFDRGNSQRGDESQRQRRSSKRTLAGVGQGGDMVQSVNTRYHSRTIYLGGDGCRAGAMRPADGLES